jgi:glycosyltransferase involved in cell wall biosynthesis
MAERPELRLVVTGDGSLHDRLRDEAREVLPSDRVEFVGRVDAARMADLLSRANVYLSASLSDSTSVSLLEAMASGAVPVVSDIEGNREWVADGESARMFAPGQADAVSRALRGALESGWADAARDRNRKVILERGDWATNMTRVEALFERLASQGAGR